MCCKCHTTYGTLGRPATGCSGKDSEREPMLRSGNCTLVTNRVKRELYSLIVGLLLRHTVAGQKSERNNNDRRDSAKFSGCRLEQ